MNNSTTSTTYKEQLIAAAHRYLKNGYSILPTNKKKEPACESWSQYRTKPIQTEDVEAMFSSSNVTGIGIITGRQSNIEVIDVDCYNDDTGMLWENFASALKSELPVGIFDALVLERSQSGGIHIFYRCNTVGGNVKLALTHKISKEEKPKALIETRGQGGQIVVSPTTGYSVIHGDLLSMPFIDEKDRELILSIARRFDESKTPKVEIPLPSERGGFCTFEDYDRSVDFAAFMVGHGWTVVKETEERIAFLRPGAGADSKQSANFHKRLRRLIVHSHSTEFVPGKAYSPSAVFALLECGNDLAAASRRLKADGFTETQVDEWKQSSKAELQQSFETLLQSHSTKDLRARLRNTPPALDSGYRIKDIPLLIPSAALSVASAPTSHGKTTLALNLAYNFAKESLRVLYFSYEEDADSILIGAINTAVGRTLGEAISNNAKRSVRTYFRDGTTSVIRHELQEAFRAAVREFNQSILEPGFLRITHCNYDSTDLRKAICFLAEREAVDVVIVDYVQLLSPKRSRSNAPRHAELKAVCEDLLTAAIDTRLPIILTAQFNRECSDAKGIQLNNIGEAGDIARLANLVIGLWNSSFSTASDELENGLYVKILKNRDGKANVDDFWQFDGNQGTVLNALSQTEANKSTRLGGGKKATDRAKRRNEADKR